MRLSLDEALTVGSHLEVEAISEFWGLAVRRSSPVPEVVPLISALSLRTDGTKSILLTPSSAAQCGYSMESDPWGNIRIYTSLLGCYVDNKVSG